MLKKYSVRLFLIIVSCFNGLFVSGCGWFDSEKNYDAPTDIGKISSQSIKYLWQEQFHYVEGDSTLTSKYQVDLVPDSTKSSWADNNYTLEVRLDGEEALLWSTTVKSKVVNDTVYFSPLDMSAAPRMLAKPLASSAMGTSTLPRLPIIGSKWEVASGLFNIKKSIGIKESIKIGKSNYEVWAVAESVYIAHQLIQSSIYRYGSKGLIQSEQNWEIPMAMSAEGVHLGKVEASRIIRLR